MISTAYPPVKSVRIIRFWLAFFAGLLGFGYLLIEGGYTFRGNFTVQLVGFGMALTIGLCWLIWRWMIWQDGLPRTGIEWAVVLTLLVVLASLLASPDPRQGLWRAGWALAYALFFYFFANLLNTDLDRWGLIAGAAAAVGLALLQANAETTQWYQSWFKAAGSYSLPPTPYRFTGILTASTPLLGLANLFVPFLMLAVWRGRNPAIRILSGAWLLIFALAVPFSSSRGAWLGLAVTLAIAAIFWAVQTRLLARLRAWSRRRLVLVGIALLLAFIAAGYLGVHFLTAFASSSTHGGDPFGDSGREVFWANAVRIWQASPWFGAGPGRFGFAYLEVQTAIPPGFWPMHAHNLFLEALAEFGGLGLAALLLMLFALGKWGWRTYRQTEPRARAWTAALLAGLAGLLVQQVFDDLTSWMAVIVPAVFLLAWIATNTGAPLPTYRRFSLGWLVLPTFLLIAGVGWGLWAYQPYTHWLEAAQAGDWRQAATLASESAARDPAFHFYDTEAGLLWAWEWKYQNDPVGLANARASFQRALQFEPAASFNWANLAILDAAAGDTPLALQHMQQATHLAPDMPVFVYRLAQLNEQAGQTDLALAGYQHALQLDPAWAALPDWTQTPLRRQALAAWQAQPYAPMPVPAPYTQQALQAISAGRYPDAVRLLAEGELMGEPADDLASAALQLAMARADPAAIQQARDRLRQLAAQEQMDLDPLISFAYPAFLSNRDGTGITAVPGLMVESNEQK